TSSATRSPPSPAPTTTTREGGRSGTASACQSPQTRRAEGRSVPVVVDERSARDEQPVVVNALQLQERLAFVLESAAMG
ncbi:MAG: hypothetical protein JWN08_3044, partial [Frankiales bacterium]|nr:hypothetical protein [Frankiales bacterium]